MELFIIITELFIGKDKIVKGQAYAHSSSLP